MDFRLNDQQQMYVDTVRRFVRAEILPQVMDLERKHAFPMKIIRKAWEMGILNLSIPGAIKDYEIDALSSALIIMELSYGDSGIATSAMCNDLANVIIARHGTAGSRMVSPPLCRRPAAGLFCLTEPGAAPTTAP